MTERFERESGFAVASFKAADDETKGEFTALVSAFGNVDYGGDRVVKGAFAKSLAKWQASGDPIPVIWNHQWDNPLAHIGKADPALAEETDDGLLIKGTLDLDNEFAAQVYRLMSERRVKELSFGYNVVDSERKDGALNLTEVDLIEVGPTLKGMNPATQLLAVKAYGHAEMKAGKFLFEPLTGDDAAAVKRAASLLESQLTADEKAGARLSDETKSAIAQAVDLLSSLFSDDVTDDAAGKSTSVEAKASGTASDGVDVTQTQIDLLSQQIAALTTPHTRSTP